ncbi:MAG: hypothetical protein HY744_00775 [Deltaproteobacteria bacterium]|nr:hypothetical protein [Deltaproteobacteria bacterium]
MTSPVEDALLARLPAEIRVPLEFENWFQDTLQLAIESATLRVHGAVIDLVGKIESQGREQEGLERDRYDVFVPPGGLLKAPARVREKLLDDLAAAELLPLTLDELAGRVLALGDLGRFRILGSLPRDVRRCLEAMFEGDPGKMLGRFPLRGEIKDFVRDPRLREPLRGHRAVQLTVVANPDATLHVSVEIQLMTALQHAWDRRNHCFYEWLRAGGAAAREASLDLRIDDHAVAEALHVADAMADRNFEAFLGLERGIREKRP